jgi:hypothetical protein
MDVSSIKSDVVGGVDHAVTADDLARIRKASTQGLAAFNYSSIAEATITDLPDRLYTVTCHFRPKEYTFVKKNTWKEVPTTRKSKKFFQPPTFESSSAYTLAMELLFDTNEANAADQDVRKVTQKLWKMMQPKDKQHDRTKISDPPWVEFRWGKTWSFKAVIQEMKQQFILFKPDGTPVRAKVTMTFLQAADDSEHAFQNPTSGGVQDHKVHIVKDGETIDLIAFEEYGNSNAWRHLATANNLDDPTRLQAGQRLLLVPLE